MLRWKPPVQLLAVASILLGYRSTVVGEDQFPYTAYTNADSVYVRSGPGDNYYPTAKLAYGEPVEIFRHDPGDWYAIRPPGGSFSWVSGEYLQPLEAPWAVVNADRVVARVGSQLSDVRDVIQIRLERGEELEVIEAQRFGQGPAAKTWYKIAPPAGEFRWVSGKFLSLRHPGEAPADPATRRNLLIDEQPAAAARPPAPQEFSTAADAQAQTVSAETVAGDSAASVAEPATLNPNSATPGALPQPAAQPQWQEDRSGDAEDGSTAAEDRKRRIELRKKAKATATHDSALWIELDDLELALSRMMAEDPERWSLTELYARAQAAVEVANGPIERARARTVLAKVERYNALATRARDVPRVNRTVRSEAGGITGSTDRTAVDPLRDDRYDGTGRLVPVVSKRIGSPDYALVDDKGVVRCYVTPAPGVNLRHYLNQQVGIHGSLGFAAELNSRHVTAQRITALGDDVIRR